MATGTITHISTGAFHSCASTADKFECWGDDYYDQATVPDTMATGAITHIAAENYHTCASTVDKLECWGDY